MGTSGRVEGTPSAEQTELIRTRVRLVVGITTRAGKYRRGLERAAVTLTPQEAAIVMDLAERGMDVDQLRDVLWGGHVLVDDPDLYERWKFPGHSRQRISSHHHDIDKKKYPDIGMRGPLVREKLHGRTAQGTWVQLEKTPAAIGTKKLPSPQDVAHLMDYIVYRVTRRNVGPWGLSHRTERRPMYLNPALNAQVSLSEPIATALSATLHRVDADERASAASDLAHIIPAPQRDDPVAELEITAERGHGRGLFGSSEVCHGDPGDSRGQNARRTVAPCGLVAARVGAYPGGHGASPRRPHRQVRLPTPRRIRLRPTTRLRTTWGQHERR